MLFSFFVAVFSCFFVFRPFPFWIKLKWQSVKRPVQENQTLAGKPWNKTKKGKHIINDNKYNSKIKTNHENKHNDETKTQTRL